MSVDPRKDVAASASIDPVARLEARVAELARQVTVGRNDPVQVGNGPPTADPTTLREGTEYIDRTNVRKYFVVGSAWRYVTLS